MANQEKLSPWVRENVPDEAVYGEHYIIIRKEETKSGAKVHVNQVLRDPQAATITGEEVKSFLDDSASPGLGVGLLILAGIIAVIDIVCRLIGALSGFPVFAILLVGICAGAGVYQIVKSKKQAPEILTIASWEEFEPYLEQALTEKVYNGEIKAREEELGEKGKAYAGYFCVPARYAAVGDFGKAKSNMGVYDQLKEAAARAAAALPEEARKLERK